MPRLKSADPRVHYVNFRLNMAELTELQSRASRSGRSLSGYGREALFGAPRSRQRAQPATATAAPEVAEAMRLLAEQVRRAGVNLNQIARHMNETGLLPSRGLSEALDEIRSFVATARQLPDQLS